MTSLSGSQKTPTEVEALFFKKTGAQIDHALHPRKKTVLAAAAILPITFAFSV